MRIIKVLNNNTVCVIDDKGVEQIISGKGVGFSKKCGDRIVPDQTHKTYLITDSGLRKRMIDCLSEIPYEYIEMTDDLVEHIKSVMNTKLNESLFVTLSDHIWFAIQRKQQGIEFSNPLMDSIRECFPQELKLGAYCVEQIKVKTGIQLHPDEAGFIAMHIINARLSSKMSQVHDLTRMINGCLDIVDKFYSGKIDKTTSAYTRFKINLKELAQRLCTNKVTPVVLNHDEDLSMMIKSRYGRHYKCAKCIQDYILKIYEKSITEDELLLMTLYLQIAVG